MKIEINVNETVKVKLTDAGMRVLEADWASYFGLKKPSHAERYRLLSPKVDGFHEMPLWELMRVFGPHMHLGMPNALFEGNDLLIGGLPR